MMAKDEAFRLTRFSYSDLADSAATIRNDFSKHYITYSPRVGLPLTHEYNKDCPYCSGEFVSVQGDAHMTLEDVQRACHYAESKNTCEAYIHLDDNIDIRHLDNIPWLSTHGYTSIIDYVIDSSKTALLKNRLLPNINSGAISDREIRSLKEVSVSQGLSLESIAGRLTEPGGPHFGFPGKSPARKLATLEAAGRAQVPFSTGILVGIGDSRHERIEGLLAILELHQRYGHIQEVIIDKYTPNIDVDLVETTEEEILWTIASARHIFGNAIHIQSSPTLINNPIELIHAGIDDFGGIELEIVSSDDNHKAWSSLENLSTKLIGNSWKLRGRTCVYPEYINKPGFIAEHLKPYIAQHVNETGYLIKSPTDKGNTNFATEELKKHITSSHIDLTGTSQNTTLKIERTSNLPTSKTGN